MFTFVQICGIVVIAVLLAGFYLLREKAELDEEFNEEWMDFERWRESR